MLDWIKIAGGALVAAAICWPVAHMIGAADGRAAERAAQLARSIELIKERSKTNDKINSLDDRGLCAALDGRWVLDHCE